MKLVNLSIFLSLFGIGCAVALKKQNRIPLNPTVYLFEFPKEAIQHTIKKEFLEKKYRWMTLEYAGKTTIRSVEAEKRIATNPDDFYLHREGDNIGKSKVYWGKNGEELDYIAEFHIHLVSINDTRTRVDIFTIDPKVITGEHFLPSFPHFGSHPKYKKVQGSTIEEYEILLKIGEGLGCKNQMPILQN